MPLKSIVKVSHISNLSDARYCAGMGVELLGVRVIEGDEYFMAPAVFQEIRGWISGPKIIAELYGISSAESIALALQTYAPDYFELNADEYQKFRNKLTLPCIVYFPDASMAKHVSPEDNVSHILVDADTSCAGMAPVRQPVLVKIESLEELNEKSQQACFGGYELSGPRELRPGVTNYDQLGAILEALDED